MPYRSYEDVARLGPDAQRQLLQQGEAVERVWAAWALGMALGTHSTPDLLASVRESPAAGTRRHLLVVLAGFGERDVLHIFADQDPDAYVRATACQYLIRISLPTDDVTAQFLRERVLHDPSAIVREAILGAATASFPPLHFEDLAELAHDPDLDVRQAATERLLATEPLDRLFPGILEDRIPDEDNADLRHRLLAVSLETGGAARLLALSMRLESARSLEILRFLVDAKQHVGWEQIAPLSLAPDPQRDLLLIHLLQPASTISALPWLLRGIARAVSWPQSRNQADAEHTRTVNAYAWQATQRLIAARLQLQTLDRVPCDQSIIQSVIAYLQDEIAQLQWEQEHHEWEPDEWEEEAGWTTQAIYERRMVVDALAQLQGIDE